MFGAHPPNAPDLHTGLGHLLGVGDARHDGSMHILSAADAIAADAIAAAALVPAWISAVAAILGVATAIFVIMQTAKQIRTTAREMAKTAKREAADSEARTRPYVSVDIVPGLQGAPIFDIVIRNSGETIARNVRLSLDEGFNALIPEDEIGPGLGKMFDQRFELAPRTSRRVMWRLGWDQQAHPSGEMGVPEAGEITISYEWEQADGTVQRYSERQGYDLTEYGKLIPVPSTGGASPGKDASNLMNAVKALSIHVAELRR